MKTMIILVLLSVAFLAFAGCVEEQSPSNNDEGNDDSGNTTDNTTGDEDEDDEEDNEDDQTVTAGWYLKEVIDFDDKVISSHDYYSYDVIYNRENITTILFGDNSEELRVRSTWSRPPDFVEASEEISIYMKKEGLVISTGGLGLDDKSSIAIDVSDMQLGYGTSSKYRLSNTIYGEFLYLGYNDEPGTIKEGTFKANAPSANAFNGEFGLTFEFVNGGAYGTKYIYEWRE